VFGIGQTLLGVLAVAGGVGWHIMRHTSAASPTVKIPDGLGGIDPSFASISKAVEETTLYTQQQIDLLIKDRDARIATLKSIKPGGSA
jgi:hypothetical protein